MRPRVRLSDHDVCDRCSKPDTDDPMTWIDTVLNRLQDVRRPIHFLQLGAASRAVVEGGEVLLFGFSHRLLDSSGLVPEDSATGNLHYRNQTFDFLEKLRPSLMDDPGSILHWGNEVPQTIEALRSRVLSEQPPNAAALLEMFDALLGAGGKSRRLVDLAELLASTPLHDAKDPESLRVTLLGALRQSPRLLDVYTRPTGDDRGRTRPWITLHEGQPVDPWHELDGVLNHNVGHLLPTIPPASDASPCGKRLVSPSDPLSAAIYQALLDTSVRGMSRFLMHYHAQERASLHTLALSMLIEALDERVEAET
jgi:hypothetical protein